MYELLVTIAFVATAPLLLAQMFAVPDSGSAPSNLGPWSKVYLVALVIWAGATWLL